MEDPVLVPVIIEMAVSKITIKPVPNNVVLPQDIKKVHPLDSYLTLVAVLIQWKC